MGCEKTDNADVPLAYIGLKILLAAQDRNSLSNIVVILAEHSFKGILIIYLFYSPPLPQPQFLLGLLGKVYT